MIRSTRRLSAVAARAALALALAGALAGGAQAHTASARINPSHKPPGGHITPAAQAFPSHRPLSGNYPGSYTSATAPSVRAGAGFDWVAAGIGAAGMLGLVLLLTALRAARRSRTLDIPLVLEVRDNRPA